MGYGYRSSDLRINVNLYRTEWKDRFQRRGNITIGAVTNNYAEISGITQLHYGAEFEATYSIGKYVDLEGAFSWGDWRYKGNATGELFDDNNQPISATSAPNVTLNLDKVKVGDAAQVSAALGATFKPVKGLRINANWRWYDQLYARFDPIAFDSSLQTATYTPPALEKGALRLPSYNLFDLGASYKFELGGRQSLILGANVYNLFDTTYISEATTNNHTDLNGKAISFLQVQEHLHRQASCKILQTYNAIKAHGKVFTNLTQFISVSEEHGRRILHSTSNKFTFIKYQIPALSLGFFLYLHSTKNIHYGFQLHASGTPWFCLPYLIGNCRFCDSTFGNHVRILWENL